MKRSTLISVTLASLILISISAAAPQVQAQRQLTLTTYAAKFVCGKSDQKIASPGQYFTMINVHNPSPFNRAVYIKRFAIALPEERPGKISNFAGGILGPDEAMTIDCENIYKHTEVPPGQFLEGFALIYALTELDVVSVYTAGHAEVETLHSERVPARKLVIARTNAMAERLLRQPNLQ
jgi:hypothetical protein